MDLWLQGAKRLWGFYTTERFILVNKITFRVLDLVSIA